MGEALRSGTVRSTPHALLPQCSSLPVRGPRRAELRADALVRDRGSSVTGSTRRVMPPRRASMIWHVRLAPQRCKSSGSSTSRFSFRDLRPKAATDMERHHGMAETRRFLGHTTEAQTADYVRDRIGELVDPVAAAKPEWLAKVLSPNEGIDGTNCG